MANFDTLKATIAARIPDNIDQLITAEDVRQSFLDTIDEINAAKEDDGAVAPAVWGGIGGNIADQTDLKNALDGKADKVAGATTGHLAGLDANGDLTDSGSKASDFATAAQGAKADTAVQPGDLATVASTGDYDDLLNKPTIPPGVVVDQTYDATSTDAQSGVAMAGALAGKQDTISNLATIEAGAAAGATAVQPGSLAAVATSGSYADLLNKPTIPAAPGTLNTDNSTAQTTSSSEALSGAVKLHKVSKTGSYNDLLNKPTIPAAQVQADWNEADNTKADYIKNKPTIPAAQVNADWDAVSGVAQILNKPTIPAAPGTLDTTATTAQATNASEALSGAVKLHKISKTGSYADLNNKPAIPAAQVNSDWNAGSGVAQILNKPSLATVATSGSYNDLLNKPTIPAAQVQADWDEADNTAADYIKNKPSIPTVPTISTDVVADRASNAKTTGAKAVFDAFCEWGVISQTQTWTGSNAAGWDYTMSDLVWGAIPKANIDLYVAAGATFNQTTGYFELNGLTDLSYEEMKTLYNLTVGIVPSVSARSLNLAELPVRTNIPMAGNLNYGVNLAYLAYVNKTIEVVAFRSEILTSSLMSATFFSCERLKRVEGIIRTTASTGTHSSTFGYCYCLEEVRLKLKLDISFPNSSRLSLDSVAYMVNNATNTSAITITLHATAYARCVADTTEYTYNSQTYTGIIAYAAAKNITIASA